LAKKLGVDFMEVSALSGDNVNALFEKVALAILSKSKQPGTRSPKEKKRGGCLLV
jgi:hypothetical protein